MFNNWLQTQLKISNLFVSRSPKSNSAGKNIIRKFKEGWIPKKDNEWLDFHTITIRKRSFQD